MCVCLYKYVMVNDYAINYGNLCTTTAVYSAHQFYAEVFLLNSMSKIQTELNLSISGIFSNLLFMCSNPTAIKSSLIFRQVTMSMPLKRLMLKCVSLRPKRYKNIVSVLQEISRSQKRHITLLLHFSRFTPGMKQDWYPKTCR